MLKIVKGDIYDMKLWQRVFICLHAEALFSILLFLVKE